MSERRFGTEPPDRAPHYLVVIRQERDTLKVVFSPSFPFPHVKNLLMFVIDCIAQMLKY